MLLDFTPEERQIKESKKKEDPFTFVDKLESKMDVLKDTIQNMDKTMAYNLRMISTIVDQDMSKDQYKGKVWDKIKFVSNLAQNKLKKTDDEMQDLKNGLMKMKTKEAAS